MTRWLRWLVLNPLAVVLLLILLLIIAVVVLLATRSGTHLLLGQAQRFIPALTLQHAEGTLLRGLTLQQAAWQDATTAITAHNIELQHRLELANPSTLHLEKLHVERLQIKVLPTASVAASTEPFTLPDIALPVQIEVQEVRIGELQIDTGAQPLRFRDVLLRARAQDGRLQIDNLSAEAYDAQGKAQLAVRGDMGLLQPHPLNAHLRVTSDSRAWGVGQAAVQLGGGLQQYTLDMDADWQYAHYPRYQGKLQGQGTFNEMTLTQLQLDGAAGQLKGEGKLGWEQDLRWDASLNATRLNPGVFAADWQANLDLAVKSQGTLAADGTPQVAVEISRLQGKLRDYPVDVKGQGEWNGKLLNLRSVDAKVGDNRLQASGTAAEQLAVEWKLDAPRLQQLHPKLSGNAQGNGTLRGQADGSQLQLEVQTLSGKLQGYTLNANGKVDWGKDILALQDVLIESGGNRLQASGQATEPFDLRWQVDAPNLAQAWQGLAGRLQGAGTLKGKLEQPQIQADLQGSQLRYQDLRLGKLAATIQQQGERYTLKAQLDDFRQGDNVLHAATLQGEGSISKHRISAQLNHAVGKLAFTANGGWQQNQWQGTLPNLSLRDTPAGHWEMLAPLNLQASAQAFSSSKICLGNAQKAQVCAKPEWKAAEGVNLDGDLQRVPLAMFKPWLPENLQAAGTVDATYSVAQRAGKPLATVSLRLPDSSINIRTAQGKTETLRYANTRAQLDLNDRQVELNTQLDLPTYGQVRADGGITLSPSDGKHQVNIRVNAEMPDIAWLERFAPAIDRLKGSLNAALTISGNLAKPNLSGAARLLNAQLFLPETGATLDNINLTLQANGTERATLDGSLRAGTGVLTVAGVLSLANLPQWQADVSLQGDQLKLMDTHEVMALVSPALRLEAAPAKLAIGGKIVIPEATINLRELPPSASARSDDVIIVGRQTAQGQSANVSLVEKDVPLAIQPNVLIELGDKVKFNGFGLDARLAGKLRVLRTRQDIIAEGVLDVIDGVYKAYGQNLKIERGRLLFNGALDNPGLNIRALREINDELEVGIDLKGTVQQPESTLFSTPQQTQSDTLSYLLTGRPTSSLTGDQAGILMNAIEGLGISGGNSLAQRLGGSLGLDELGIQSKSGNVNQSELTMGKRLGAKLYVRYIVGLFDSLQRLALTYQINKQLQVEAQSGLQQSVDLIYKIDTERGPLGR